MKPTYFILNCSKVIALACLLALQACEDVSSENVEVETLTPEEVTLIDFGNEPVVMTCSDLETDLADEILSYLPLEMESIFLQECSAPQLRSLLISGKNDAKNDPQKTDKGNERMQSLYETKIKCTGDRSLCLICRYSGKALESCDIYH